MGKKPKSAISANSNIAAISANWTMAK